MDHNQGASPAGRRGAGRALGGEHLCRGQLRRGGSPGGGGTRQAVPQLHRPVPILGGGCRQRLRGRWVRGERGKWLLVGFYLCSRMGIFVARGGGVRLCAWWSRAVCVEVPAAVAAAAAAAVGGARGARGFKC